MIRTGRTAACSINGRPPTSELPLSRVVEPARSLYIHVPFCTHKCHYCDFYSFVDTRDRQAAFVEALGRELRTMASLNRCGGGEKGVLETIFVGGGTPSLLRPDLWSRLLETLHGAFSIGADTEFTVECNPDTVTAALMGVLVGGGVNRVSVGAQSFEPRHLRTLERTHDPANVTRAIGHAWEAGVRRVSLDLIYGIPDQTVDEWASDLDAAFGAAEEAGGGLEHLSAYALTYEPNTAMTKRMERGDFEPMDEETEVAMYARLIEATSARGLERYEVSNFARPGAACRHNLAYWRQRQWLAAGPSASGHVAGHRWKNVPRLTDWLDAAAAEGFSPVDDLETPDARRAIAERLMTGLRLTEGVPTSEVRGAVEGETWDRLLAERASLVSCGWLADDADVWRLTSAGFLFADGAASQLMMCVLRSA